MEEVCDLEGMIARSALMPGVFNAVQRAEAYIRITVLHSA